jgi:acylphosphatase
MRWTFGRPHDDPGPTPGDAPGSGTVRMTAWVHGMVQGVGFRWWTRSRAMELGLVGSASNLGDGRVEVVVEGSREACVALLTQLRGARTPGGVDHVEARFGAARGGFRGFTER